MRLRIHLLLLLLIVGFPLALGGFAFLWREICRGLFIPGAFLLPLAVLAAYPFALYCAPVHALLGNLCFSTTAFDGLVARPLPCDLNAWLAVAACYGLVSVALGAFLAPRLIARLARSAR